MASAHTLRTVTIGEYEFRIGQLVKLQLGHCLEGSLTSIATNAISITSTSSPPTHSALVLGTGLGPDMFLEVECYPIPSCHCEPDPVGRVRQHPSTQIFLPLPSPAHVETPHEFGEPIRTRGYINDRPYWVHLKQVTVRIKFGKNVRFSASHESLLLLMPIIDQGVRSSCNAQLSRARNNTRRR